MKAISILILILNHPLIFAQGIFTDSLSLTINEDSLICESSCKALTVSITFSNDSKEDILTYGIADGPYPAPFSLSKFYELENSGTGLAFALYRSDGIQETLEIVIHDRYDRKSVTRDLLDSVLHASHKRFLTTERILKKHERVSFVHELPLEKLYLVPGVYHLQMVYYCGNTIFNVIDMSNLINQRAKLFQGCAMSNKIPFIVK